MGVLYIFMGDFVCVEIKGEMVFGKEMKVIAARGEFVSDALVLDIFDKCVKCGEVEGE